MRFDKQDDLHITRLRLRSASIVLFALMVLPLSLALADSPAVPGIEVSGHFDVQAVGHNAAVRDNDFQVGQAVVNLASELQTRISANLQIAYNLDEEVDIGQAYVDMNVFKWDGRPRRNTLGVIDAGFRMGQFDVPFGLDWRVYSSMDRELVSLPTVIGNTHRGWNDVGVMFYGNTTWSNWAIFAVNGFGTSPALRLPSRYASTSLAAAELPAAGNFGSVAPTEAFGARGGIVVNENIEFGTSFGAGYTDDDEQDETLWAFDVTARFEQLEVKGEFISQERHRTTNNESVRGYYIQGVWNQGPFYGVVRQDTYNPDGTVVYPFETVADGSLYCASFGGGYRFGPDAQLRLEYQLAEGSSNDIVYVQTAVAF
jgi:hypothetical protein